jgi:cation transport ATPase
MDSFTMLIALLLGGRWVEEAGRTRADRAADAVSGRLPAMARRVTDAGVEDVPASSLVVGDRVIVGLGSIVPADGTVVAAAGGDREDGEQGALVLQCRAVPIRGFRGHGYLTSQQGW